MSNILCFPDPKPIIVLEQDTLNSQHFADYDLTLTCSISVSSPVVDQVNMITTWSKDGIQYASNSWVTHIFVTQAVQINNGHYATSLKFSPLGMTDSGTYECTAILTSFTGTFLTNSTVNISVMVKGEP